MCRGTWRGRGGGSTVLHLHLHPPSQGTAFCWLPFATDLKGETIPITLSQGHRRYRSRAFSIEEFNYYFHPPPPSNFAELSKRHLSHFSIRSCLLYIPRVLGMLGTPLAFFCPLPPASHLPHLSWHTQDIWSFLLHPGLGWRCVLAVALV